MRFQGARELILVKERAVVGDGFLCRIGNCVIGRSVRGVRRVGDFALEIAVDHGQGAAGEVAESVGEIGVVALNERVELNEPSCPKTTSRSKK